MRNVPSQKVNPVPWDVLLGSCGAGREDVQMTGGLSPMLYLATSDKAMDRVCEDFRVAITKRQFGVMAVHNLRETMAKKGVDFSRECRIFEVCNPHKAKQVLERRMEISTALPCRVSIYQDGDRVTLATILPSMLLQMFKADGLEGVAREVEDVMVASMDEAAGG